MANTVTIPVETARLIMLAFLPRNTRKMRGANPEVVKAADDFKAAVTEACRT